MSNFAFSSEGSPCPSPSRTKEVKARKRTPSKAAAAADDDDDFCDAPSTNAGNATASQKAFGQEEFVALAYAVTKVASSNMSSILELAPELEPWRQKGRLHDKLKQLMRSARGGETGVNRFVAENATGSPAKRKKKQPDATTLDVAAESGAGPASGSTTNKRAKREAHSTP